jgi:hypothetical protein
MSPTNLGQLPVNQPPPTGLCQIKRGAANGVVNYSQGVGVTPISDGASGVMRINITPPRAGWWVIRAEAIWTLADAQWYYCQLGLRLVPLDADGRGDDRNHICIHNALSWQEMCFNSAYRLNAGVAYYAEMYWPQSANAGTWGVWTGPDYTFIFGEFIEDGSL